MERDEIVSNSPSKDELMKHIDFWLRSAYDNLETANSLLNSKRYNFCMFMCQQTLEALLKSVFISIKEERPLYIHNLPKLLSAIEIDVPVWLDKVVLKVNAHYIKILRQGILAIGLIPRFIIKKMQFN